MPTAYLPPDPDLRQLKKQARDLLRAHQSGDAEVCSRLRAALCEFATLSDDEITQYMRDLSVGAREPLKFVRRTLRARARVAGGVIFAGRRGSVVRRSAGAGIQARVSASDSDCRM